MNQQHPQQHKQGEETPPGSRSKEAIFSVKIDTPPSPRYDMETALLVHDRPSVAGLKQELQGTTSQNTTINIEQKDGSIATDEESQLQSVVKRQNVASGGTPVDDEREYIALTMRQKVEQEEGLVSNEFQNAKVNSLQQTLNELRQAKQMNSARLAVAQSNSSKRKRMSLLESECRSSRRKNRAAQGTQEATAAATRSPRNLRLGSFSGLTSSDNQAPIKLFNTFKGVGQKLFNSTWTGNEADQIQLVGKRLIEMSPKDSPTSDDRPIRNWYEEQHRQLLESSQIKEHWEERDSLIETQMTFYVEELEKVVKQGGGCASSSEGGNLGNPLPSNRIDRTQQPQQNQGVTKKCPQQLSNMLKQLSQPVVPRTLANMQRARRSATLFNNTLTQPPPANHLNNTASNQDIINFLDPVTPKKINFGNILGEQGSNDQENPAIKTFRSQLENYNQQLFQHSPGKYQSTIKLAQSESNKSSILKTGPGLTIQQNSYHKNLKPEQQQSKSKQNKIKEISEKQSQPTTNSNTNANANNKNKVPILHSIRRNSEKIAEEPSTSPISKRIYTNEAAIKPLTKLNQFITDASIKIVHAMNSPTTISSNRSQKQQPQQRARKQPLLLCPKSAFFMVPQTEIQLPLETKFQHDARVGQNGSGKNQQQKKVGVLAAGRPSEQKKATYLDMRNGAQKGLRNGINFRNGSVPSALANFQNQKMNNNPKQVQQVQENPFEGARKKSIQLRHNAIFQARYSRSSSNDGQQYQHIMGFGSTGSQPVSSIEKLQLRGKSSPLKSTSTGQKKADRSNRLIQLSQQAKRIAQRQQNNLSPNLVQPTSGTTIKTYMAPKSATSGLTTNSNGQNQDLAYHRVVLQSKKKPTNNTMKREFVASPAKTTSKHVFVPPSSDLKQKAESHTENYGNTPDFRKDLDEIKTDLPSHKLSKKLRKNIWSYNHNSKNNIIEDEIQSAERESNHSCDNQTHSPIKVQRQLSTILDSKMNHNSPDKRTYDDFDENQRRETRESAVQADSEEEQEQELMELQEAEEQELLQLPKAEEQIDLLVNFKASEQGEEVVHESQQVQKATEGLPSEDSIMGPSVMPPNAVNQEDVYLSPSMLSNLSQLKRINAYKDYLFRLQDLSQAVEYSKMNETDFKDTLKLPFPQIVSFDGKKTKDKIRKESKLSAVDGNQIGGDLFSQIDRQRRTTSHMQQTTQAPQLQKSSKDHELFFDINKQLVPVAFPTHFSSQHRDGQKNSPSLQLKKLAQHPMSNWDIKQHKMDVQINMAAMGTKTYLPPKLSGNNVKSPPQKVESHNMNLQSKSTMESQMQQQQQPQMNVDEMLLLFDRVDSMVQDVRTWSPTRRKFQLKRC